jgi:hypothetical protein
LSVERGRLNGQAIFEAAAAANVGDFAPLRVQQRIAHATESNSRVQRGKLPQNVSQQLDIDKTGRAGYFVARAETAVLLANISKFKVYRKKWPALIHRYAPI